MNRAPNQISLRFSLMMILLAALALFFIWLGWGLEASSFLGQLYTSLKLTAVLAVLGALAALSITWCRRRFKDKGRDE